MESVSQTDIIPCAETDQTKREIKAVQVARMSTFVLALITTVLTISTQYMR